MNVAERSSEPLGSVDLRIPSKPEWVAVARLAVAAIANRLPFSVEEIEDLKLAMAEACTICIQHGGGEMLDIHFEALADQLRIELRDQRYRLRAAGSNVKREESQAPAEGLGVFLIQALMDNLQYDSDAQLGTELIMTKRVP